jgi:pimeloyl-ACP methyl ester carboxylesterase
MAETVVIVPGVGLGGAEMFVLSSRLRRRGYAVTVFYHCPWRGTLADKTRALAALLDQIDSSVVHFVGHSMGGLVVLYFLAHFPCQRPGRVVLLGTPVNGSVAARRVLRLPLGRFLIGRCMAAAASDEPLPLPLNREVGSIAGRVNLALGWLLRLPRPNDTLVAVCETQHPDMRDTRVLAVSHGSMLLSVQVAESVDSFLRTGAFMPCAA